MPDPVGECILTLAGIDAYVQASATGSTIQPKTFKASSTDYNLDPTLTDISGWLDTDISLYAAEYGADTVEFTLDVPPDLATGYFRTAGLFLADGTLFAIAKPPYALPPAVHQQIKVQIVYNNAVALTDFIYLSWDEQEQDISRLEMQAVLGDQVLKNAEDIGRLKEMIAENDESATSALFGAGMADLLGKVLTNFGIRSYHEVEEIQRNVSGLCTLDLNLACNHAVYIGGDTTFTLTGGPPAGNRGSINLWLKQSANASSIAWPPNLKWAGGSEPNVSTNSSEHIFVLWTRDGGVTWYGHSAGANMAVPE